MIIFLIGILIGLVVAVPMGPVGLLCIRKTLEFGLKGTLAVGIGTALADALYAGIAAFGLAVVSGFILKHVVYLKLFGGTLLFSLAIKEFFSTTTMVESVELTTKNSLSLMFSTFLLTCSNPIGIASFIAIFAMLGHHLPNMHHAALIVLGVFVGSMGWFLILGRIVHRTQHLLPDNLLANIHKISAILLAAFGSWAFFSLT